MKKELKRLRKLAEGEGWTVEQAGSGHLKYVPADRDVEFYMVSASPSDHRSWRNLVSELRRRGLPVDTKGARLLTGDDRDEFEARWRRDVRPTVLRRR